jgi:hypothetical protein
VLFITVANILANMKSVKLLNVLYNVNSRIYYNKLANYLSNKKQSAVVGSLRMTKINMKPTTKIKGTMPDRIKQRIGNE